MGRLKSFHGINPKIRKLTEGNHGYLCAGIDGKLVLIHRIVAEAFVPNPNNLPVAHHKDENKLNNLSSNLEWVDYSYNTTFSVGVSIQAVDEQDEVFFFDSIKAGAEWAGIDAASIHSSIKKNRPRGGYYWFRDSEVRKYDTQ